MRKGIYSKLRETIDTTTSDTAKKEWSSVQKKSKKPLFNYRFDHVKRVVALTEFLAGDTNAKQDVAVLAAWLHDVAKPGIHGPENHGEVSAKAASKMLSDLGINKSIVEEVSNIIRKHVGLTLDEPIKPLEAQILWEADKLSKLGATGLVHYLINGIRLNPGMSLADISDSITDFIPLAEEIAGSMYTEKAKQIASRRLKTLKAFAKALRAELHLGEI